MEPLSFQKNVTTSYKTPPHLDDSFHLLPVQLAVPVLVVHLEGPLESVFQVSP